MSSPPSHTQIYKTAVNKFYSIVGVAVCVIFNTSVTRSLLLLAVAMILVTPSSSYCQAPGPDDPQIEITQFVPPSAQKSVNIAFKIKNASDKRIRVKVDTEVNGITSDELPLSTKGEHVIVVNLFDGVNTITFIGFVNDVRKKLKISNSPADSLKVECKGKWCYEKLTEKTVVYEFGEESRAEGTRQTEQAAAGTRQNEPATAPTRAEASADTKKEGGSKSHISITQPSEAGGPIRYQNAGEVELEIRVDQKPNKKENIKSVAVTVLNEEGPVDQEKVELKYAEKTTEPAVAKPSLKVGKGTNKVTVFDPKDAEKETTSINIICEGDDCGKTNDDTPTDRFSSIYTRGIVGFEQSGGSAAQSIQKPFLEFFWNPPVWTSEGQNEPFRYIYPKASLWGSVRFTSVPQQISTPLITFAPSFLAPINEANVNKLVQGFDFLFGGEMGFGRGFSKGDIGTAFLPTGNRDTKQKYSAYLIAGFGASSPLSPSDTVSIFKAPTTQSELDKIRPGLKLPAGTEYIAFAGPDRDSFFRQWYAGVRLKTHYFQKGSNGKLDLINRPGGMFDIAVGQNEAVTGGRLHGMVMRFDGFYPLPVSNRSILYLYGNASINLRRHATITDPLILATAPSNITVPADNVFLITSEPSNRDVYRIGVGVNLIELFKGSFNKKPEKKD